jgi:hypothetical protein
MFFLSHSPSLKPREHGDQHVVMLVSIGVSPSRFGVARGRWGGSARGANVRARARKGASVPVTVTQLTSGTSQVLDQVRARSTGSWWRPLLPCACMHAPRVSAHAHAPPSIVACASMYAWSMPMHLHVQHACQPPPPSLSVRAHTHTRARTHAAAHRGRCVAQRRRARRRVRQRRERAPGAGAQGAAAVCASNGEKTISLERLFCFVF